MAAALGAGAGGDGAAARAGLRRVAEVAAPERVAAALGAVYATAVDKAG
jgi:hypothetical protein